MECNMHIGRSDLGRNFSTDLGLVQISEKSWKLKTSKIAHWKCLISPNMCQKIAEKRAFRTRYDLSKMCPVNPVYIGARREVDEQGVPAFVQKWTKVARNTLDNSIS